MIPGVQKMVAVIMEDQSFKRYTISEMRYSCNECCYEFEKVSDKVSRKHIEEHISAEHDGVILTCEICEKKFQYVISLKRHIYSVHSLLKKCIVISGENQITWQVMRKEGMVIKSFIIGVRCVITHLK